MRTCRVVLACNIALRASVLAVAGLTGCMVGPDYHRPQISTPAVYAEAPSPPQPAVATDADLSRWWERFNDPVLTDLIDRALANNLDLQAAASRVRQARLQEIVTRAAEYPSLSATGDAVTYHLNGNSAGASSSGGAGAGSSKGGTASSGPIIPSHLNLYSVGFDASWELDLFGGTRRAVEAAKADTEAAMWERRDGEVSLIAEVANDYLTMRAFQARIAVGQAELQREKSLFELVQARRRAGFVTELDVNQQSTALETAAAQLPALEDQAKGEMHALGVLLGDTPEALGGQLAGATALIPPPPPSLPIGLPSELLRRRPDVREAERRVAASNAQIGVQVANLYPKINLIGLGSFAGTSLDNLFSSKNLITAAVGTASQPLFDAGRRRASVNMAKEATTQAALAYRTAVLSALRDVEDALSRYHSEETRRASLTRLVEAAKKSLTIAQDQYQTGFVTFITVLQTQNTLLQAEDQLTQSNVLLLTDIVALYKALGGGWVEF